MNDFRISQRSKQRGRGWGELVVSFSTPETRPSRFPRVRYSSEGLYIGILSNTDRGPMPLLGKLLFCRRPTSSTNTAHSTRQDGPTLSYKSALVEARDFSGNLASWSACSLVPNTNQTITSRITCNLCRRSKFQFNKFHFVIQFNFFLILVIFNHPI